MNRRRLFRYILLNIFVSAAVTGTILFFYDRSHRADLTPGVSIPPLAGTTSSPAADGRVNIVSVLGAGTAASETVVLQNIGTAPLVLTGWQLKDRQGNAYTFPRLTLYPGGTLQIHTAAGEDTAMDLHWGRKEAAWSAGELVGLYDLSGVARAFYRIP